MEELEQDFLGLLLWIFQFGIPLFQMLAKQALRKWLFFMSGPKKQAFVHLYFYFLTIMLILDAHSSPKKSRKCSQFYNALKAKKKCHCHDSKVYKRRQRRKEWIILYKFFNLSKKWFSSQVVEAQNMSIGKKDLYGQKEQHYFDRN